MGAFVGILLGAISGFYLSEIIPEPYQQSLQLTRKYGLVGAGIGAVICVSVAVLQCGSTQDYRKA